MVQDANIKRMHSEKLLIEAHQQVGGIIKDVSQNIKGVCIKEYQNTGKKSTTSFSQVDKLNYYVMISVFR